MHVIKEPHDYCMRTIMLSLDARQAVCRLEGSQIGLVGFPFFFSSRTKRLLWFFRTYTHKQPSPSARACLLSFRLPLRVKHPCNKTTVHNTDIFSDYWIDYFYSSVLVAELECGRIGTERVYSRKGAPQWKEYSWNKRVIVNLLTSSQFTGGRQVGFKCASFSFPVCLNLNRSQHCQ